MRSKKKLFYFLWVVAAVLAALAAKTYPESVAPENFAVTFVDVGQGDATFFKAPCGTTVLFDGGEADEYESQLLPFLESAIHEKVDIAIVSHYHSDHEGGIYESVLDGMVKKLILPDYPDSDGTKRGLEKAAKKSGCEIEYVSKGDTIEISEDFSLEVLHPDAGGMEGNNFHNNSSLVLMARCFDTEILLTGDIESRAESEICLEKDIECDILKVAHHGSSSSSSKRFLVAANPTYAAISAGEGNSYGHPHYEVLESLENEDVRVYRTDMDGDITFEIATDGIKNIHTER
ncbi:MAG: MBL fold metallo-hydrolase [Clostridia bacterium]|nr:MBL fold metallo-hydrolase [Clostridia bacterium]